MVTAVCRTKSDPRVRLSSVEFEWVWSSTVCRKFLCGPCPSQKAAKMWHIHTQSYMACTHGMLPVHMSASPFIHTQNFTQCAIFNMIKRKSFKKKKKKKRWVLLTSQLQHVEWTVWASPIYEESTIKMLVQHTTSTWIRIKCCTPRSSFSFS